MLILGNKQPSKIHKERHENVPGVSDVVPVLLFLIEGLKETTEGAPLVSGHEQQRKLNDPPGRASLIPQILGCTLIRGYDLRIIVL